MLSRRLLSLIFVVIVVSSCSTGGRKERSQLRSFVETKDYQKALSFIDKEKFYKEKSSRLLYLYERGVILHRMGQYARSNRVLEVAKSLAEKLYTMSLSAKAKTLIANDNYDVFYGQKYERSMLHFYLSLNHFLLHQRGKTLSYKSGDKIIPEKVLSEEEKRQELQAARAEVVLWNSILENYKSTRAGKSVFKNDLLAKVYGAFIHEYFDTSSDRQIALQLYKDARELLVKNYSAYKTFNSSHLKFVSDFDKFPKLGMKKVLKDYISPTDYFNELKDFLTYKSLLLTKRMRPRELNRLVKIYRPSKKK